MAEPAAKVAVVTAVALAVADGTAAVVVVAANTVVVAQGIAATAVVSIAATAARPAAIVLLRRASNPNRVVTLVLLVAVTATTQPIAARAIPALDRTISVSTPAVMAAQASNLAASAVVVDSAALVVAVAQVDVDEPSSPAIIPARRRSVAPPVGDRARGNYCPRASLASGLAPSKLGWTAAPFQGCGAFPEARVPWFLPLAALV